ncbi:MAG TPA: FAD-dependent oxidoreductase [Streptosporangiaceae bacterium]|jgi:glycine/D-amino acid oxidase-like deaminating enzyme
MRVCVIGCGVIGAALAWRLSESAANAIVVDSAGPGTGTTAVSFAWANANGKRPRGYFELNRAGMREYDRVAEELGDASWRHNGGRLATAGHTPEIADLVAEMSAWGYPAELLDARRVHRDLEPSVHLGDPDLPVGYFPAEFCVDAVPLTTALVRQAARRGARFQFGTPVTGITPCPAGFTVTLADGTTITADAVVNATGPAASAIGAFAGRPLPMASTRGTTTLVRADNHPVRHIIHTRSLAIRPEGPNHLRLHVDSHDEALTTAALATTTRTPGAPATGTLKAGTATPSAADLAEDLSSRLRTLLPGLIGAHTTATYAGIRPIPADGLTSAGPVPETPGLYEAVTHSGITLAPLLARLLATEITTGKADPLLKDFRPSRFPTTP